MSLTPHPLACTYGSLCAGCDWLMLPFAEQRTRKTNHLIEIWGAAIGAENLPTVDFVSVAAGGLRDRADLMVDRRSGTAKLGLFDRFQSGLVDLQGCPQMSPALEAWLQDFRRIEIPVERGSVRLRVSPSGVRGVWLDLANVDVKRLLDERTTLDRLREVGAVVEIGQKRKRLVEREGALKLSDPVLETWFETYIETDKEEVSVPLYCTIGSFTQPGFEANRALVREARRLISLAGAQRAVEFGSGIGNFTFPLASVCGEVHAFEIDELALEGLKRSLEVVRIGETSLAERVVIRAGNFQISNERRAPVEFRGADLIFVDPPRSGLMKFLDPLTALAPSERPKHFVYVSCFAESFATDSARLKELGYFPQSASIVDQFPQSRHYEVVAHFVR